VGIFPTWSFPVAHTPRNYQSLRDEHARAADALNRYIEQSETPDRQDGVQQHVPEQGLEQGYEPERPEQVHRSSPGWTERGDMVSQQASAVTYNAWIVANSADRDQKAIDNAPTDAQHAVATAELNQHADGQGRGDQNSEGVRGREAAANELNRHADNAERGDNQIGKEFHGAARETLDRHIENPAQQQPAIQQQPDIDRDV
jgi:hypothetical protein